MLPDVTSDDYQKQRKETDLREPYRLDSPEDYCSGGNALNRLPQEVLQSSKNAPVYDVAESPLIAFINARSGGRMGPELLTSLYRALSNAQVWI